MVLHCKSHGQSTLVARETGVCLRYSPPKKVEVRVVVGTIEQSASRSDWWSSASIGIPVSNALVTKREGGNQDFAYPGFAKAVIDTLLLQSKGLLKSTAIRCVSTRCKHCTIRETTTPATYSHGDIACLLAVVVNIDERLRATIDVKGRILDLGCHRLASAVTILHANLIHT